MFIQVLKPACQIRREQAGDRIVITLLGSADLTSVNSLEFEMNKVIASQPRRLVLALAELDFISSLAVRSLVSAARAIKASGGTTQIMNAQPLILELIRVSKLDNLFEVTP